MPVPDKIKRLWLTLATYAILSILLVWVVDISASSILTDLQTIKLKSHANDGLEGLNFEVDRLQKSIVNIQMALDSLRARDYPQLGELKSLSSSFHLRLARTERISRPALSTSNRQQYRISFHGTMNNLVRFLKTLEDQYVCRAEHLVISPTTEDGSKLSLDLLVWTVAR